jgi:hypothetical protein
MPSEASCSRLIADAANRGRDVGAGGRGNDGEVLPFIQGCSDDQVIGPHPSQGV